MKETNWKAGLNQKLQVLGKFKYPLAILLLGLVLLAWPTEEAEAPETEAAPAETVLVSGDGPEQLEQRLAALLSNMEGAGRVEVLLQYAAGPRTLFFYKRSAAKKAGPF